MGQAVLDIDATWTQHVPLAAEVRHISDYSAPNATFSLWYADNAISAEGATLATDVAQASTRTLSKNAFSPAHALLSWIDQLRDTPAKDRWPGSSWPEPAAFEDARTFIKNLPLNTIPLPNIGLADDGEVNFLWDCEGVHVDLGFYGDGSYSLFARGKDGRRFHRESVEASEGLPADIKDILAA